MTNLSVNINKVATLRNARGENVPDVLRFATDCELFGANGITVHPRPDQRHIRYDDVIALRPIVRTEFNIEGYPCEEFMKLVLAVKPAQVTLVPDSPTDLTSHCGWDAERDLQLLTDIIDRLRDAGIRSSVFVDAAEGPIRAAAKAGADRIELYTKPYADGYAADREAAIAPFIAAADVAHRCGLGVNAGHDLNLENLHYFYKNIPHLDEVSIGHALISDALYLGIEETIRRYKECLK